MLQEKEMKELLASAKAQLKGEAIIQSCTKCDHLKPALDYIYLYLERFKDPIGFERLVAIYQKKKKLINVD